MLTGRQREIWAREQTFLDAARTMVLDEGYQALTISRVAEATHFSKGTVYQIFHSREELLAALGVQCRARLHEAIERGSRFDGRPRERILAVGEAVVHQHRRNPHDQRILKIIDAETVLEKVGEDLRSAMEAYDLRMYAILQDIIKEAISIGDLELEEDLTPQEVCFAYWAMFDGAYSAMLGGAPLDTVGIREPLASVVRSGQMLGDGLGWRPLRNEWDYADTVRRIRSTILREDSDLVEAEIVVSSVA